MSVRAESNISVYERFFNDIISFFKNVKEILGYINRKVSVLGLTMHWLGKRILQPIPIWLNSIYFIVNFFMNSSNVALAQAKARYTVSLFTAFA